MLYAAARRFSACSSFSSRWSAYHRRAENLLPMTVPSSAFCGVTLERGILLGGRSAPSFALRRIRSQAGTCLSRGNRSSEHDARGDSRHADARGAEIVFAASCSDSSMCAAARDESDSLLADYTIPFTP